MDECDHCGASFEEEDAYLRHLRDEHPDDLTRIERRRVDELDGGDGGIPTLAVVGVAAVGVLVAAALAYVLLAGGGPSADAQITPHSQGSVHYHGTMNVTIDGQTLDFSRDQYQLQDDFFHYERGNGDRWHVHGEDVTLEYGLATLGIEVTGSSVTFDGTTYEDGDEGTNVTVTVNGESVDPKQYVLEQGDQVRVIVTTE
ncbi:YbdD/YjiX family protein [Halostella litorea]|uniref:YbdD/YjiX family protein n=1 Tax=Halostella litorea TaxID=2528831 RepID=UPI001091A83B|nr:YbdD/YjiX family protein [Halostella litorea]